MIQRIIGRIESFTRTTIVLLNRNKKMKNNTVVKRQMTTIARQSNDFTFTYISIYIYTYTYKKIFFFYPALVILFEIYMNIYICINKKTPSNQNIPSVRKARRKIESVDARRKRVSSVSLSFTSLMDKNTLEKRKNWKINFTLVFRPLLLSFDRTNMPISSSAVTGSFKPTPVSEQSYTRISVRHIVKTTRSYGSFSSSSRMSNHRNQHQPNHSIVFLKFHRLLPPLRNGTLLLWLLSYDFICRKGFFSSNIVRGTLGVLAVIVVGTCVGVPLGLLLTTTTTSRSLRSLRSLTSSFLRSRNNADHHDCHIRHDNDGHYCYDQ